LGASPRVRVHILADDPPDIADVDLKLVELAVRRAPRSSPPTST
jgi:hypothetical protein